MKSSTLDLYKRHDQLIELKKKTYEKLYVRCFNQIQLTANAGELICIFEIPSFVFGSEFPLINVESCANYIMNRLAKDNEYIRTFFVQPNMILIDWRRDRDY